MLESVPTWFWIFFSSMVPWWEGRYAVVAAMVHFGWKWWQALPLAVVGNIIPIPFILLFFNHVERFLRRYRFWVKIMDWLFSKTRKRANKKIHRYEHIGLLLFVAIPLPFTGAWTGALIAYLFDLDFYKSLATIFIGILVASVITTSLTLFFGNIFGI